MADINKYAAERKLPDVAACAPANINLTFNGQTLILHAGEKIFAYAAKSGREGKYKPIPIGQYWIQPDELWYCKLMRPFTPARHFYDHVGQWAGEQLCNARGWGSYRITIHPYPTTVTNGRGGFFIHGGSHDGSAGCINLNNRITDFVSDLKMILQKKEHCAIPLTVTYPI